MKRLSVVALLLFVFLPACVAADNASPEEMLKKRFPGKNFESITPTAIKGIYEVYTGSELYYYAPDTDIVIYGNMVSRDGRSLTRESFLKKMGPKMASLPLDSALKIGKGKKVIIEFMDPDCFHCREAYKFFAKRKDVTINIFFYPLSQSSLGKIKQILCASDRIKMYEEVMQGKYDKSKLSICSDKKADDILKTHMKLAAGIGLRSTPIFYFKGQAIDGFDVPVFEQLLKD